ncbi:hypothetical protein [Rhizobium leguminosarum]|uniref:hypothetical protein n=1 Tax=Rhizobium leguminosarum TaxID=384 RepID=UPI0013DD7CD3|nr:hypothetical protein [Rhizobium leguminosarum]NEK35620.1 hypothetical protein [Rhizobium leguminosarum]
MVDAGPFSIEPDCFGQSVPCYALTFDKQGLCTSPKSFDHLISFLGNDNRTDVILFSHGWNNDWPTALKRYMDFLRGVSESAKERPGMLPSDFRPVFVGVHWPSTILTWPSEDAPDIAGEENDSDLLDPLTEILSSNEIDRLRTLLEQEKVDLEQARAFASVIAPALLSTDDANEGNGPFGADDLVNIWRHAGEVTAAQSGGSMTGGGFDDFGVPGGSDDIASPSPAGFLDTFSPRNLARLATVLMMKDRAGVVGAAGVADVVRRVLNESATRLHLVGHSYGAKVVMTALVRSLAVRPAHSVLLLQPAISHLAFAKDASGGTPGGFRQALKQVSTPIFTTYSPHDFPLTRIFHWAARRRTDLGEIQAAGAPPSKYAALGGYGPSGMVDGEAGERSLPEAGGKYDTIPTGVELVTLNGAVGITGHGDVTNPYTFWAMHNLMR